MRTLMHQGIGILTAIVLAIGPSMATLADDKDVGEKQKIRTWELVESQSYEGALVAIKSDHIQLKNLAGEMAAIPFSQLAPSERMVLARTILQQSEARLSIENGLLVGQSRPGSSETPLEKIEKYLDLITDLPGSDIAAALTQYRTYTVTRSVTVNVPESYTVLSYELRYEWRCICGRWQCVQVCTPVQEQRTRSRAETKTVQEVKVDDRLPDILAQLSSFKSPPTPEQKTEIKKLLLRAYGVIALRANQP